MDNNGVKKETGAYYEEYLPAVDFKDGLNRVMNNKNLYKSLLKSFSGPEMADELIRFIKEKNNEKVAFCAHKIKGVAANLGFNQLWKVSIDIEACGKAEKDASEFVGEFQQAITTVSDFINALMSE